jgi:hypothetical protein
VPVGDIEAAGTWMARMKREGGVRNIWLATSVVWICRRSAARKMISLMTPGQASASTQICMATGPAGCVRGEAGQPGKRG